MVFFPFFSQTRAGGVVWSGLSVLLLFECELVAVGEGYAWGLSEVEGEVEGGKEVESEGGG